MTASSFAKKVAAIPATSWASALASVPILLWANDSLFSLYRVAGSSMEPSLRHGDIVIVRKSDGIWQKQTRKEEDPIVTFQRQQQIDLEKIHCHSNGVSWLIHKPPIPVVDDIIVYKDPTEYPWRYNIKRCVALGQQIVMMPSNRYKPASEFQMETRSTHETFSSMRVASPCVPSYSLWLEGDNIANSKVSSNASHGPVTKKLLVGVAEYRIWPPTRIGKIGKSTDLREEPKPYAYWPQV
jgi:signal peptidase I